MVTCLPGFDNIPSLIQAFQDALYGLKMVQSNGCNLCDVWYSSVSKKVPFSFATLMARIEKWDS